MDNLEAVLAGGPPGDDELALRPRKSQCNEWRLALRHRKAAMLFTLLRLVRKAYNLEAYSLGAKNLGTHSYQRILQLFVY